MSALALVAWRLGDVEEVRPIVLLAQARAEQRIAEGLARGKLSVFLRGHKLKGSFALVRMKQQNEWLLIKHNDRFSRAAPPVTEADREAARQRRPRGQR